MKVLLLCNTIIPELAEEHGLRVPKPESWIKGIYEDMKHSPDLEVMYLFQYGDNVTFTENNFTFRNYTQKYSGRVSPGEAEYFAEMIKSFRPDVVHVFGTEYSHSYAMACACEGLGCTDKLIVNIQGLVSFYYHHYYAYLPTEILRRKTFRDLLRHGGIFNGREDFRKQGMLETATIRKVRNIIGRTDWDESCVKTINPDARYFFCNETLRKSFYDSPKWSPDNCERYSIFVSQSGYPVKGFHLLLEAMPEIIRQYPNVHVYTTGDSPVPDTFMKWLKRTSYRKYTAQLIRKYKLEDYITFTGYLNETEMCRRFLNSHVFISPSSIENSPNSLGEAMILGVPCVSSDVGGVKNMLTHGLEGFTYPADEFYMIPYYVSKIFSDDAFALELSRNAITHAEHTHNRKINYDRLMDIYRAVMRP